MSSSLGASYAVRDRHATSDEDAGRALAGETHYFVVERKKSGRVAAIDRCVAGPGQLWYVHDYAPSLCWDERTSLKPNFFWLWRGRATLSSAAEQQREKYVCGSGEPPPIGIF